MRFTILFPGLLILLVGVVGVALANFDDETRLHLGTPRQLLGVTDVIRIGTTHISYGPLAGYGRLTVNAWKLFIARNPTYTINGTTYAVELVSYLDDMDPADGNTTEALVERLVLQDKVHVLMSPYEGNTLPNFILTAERLGVPCINVGAFAFSFYPSSYFSWTVNIMPSLATLGLQCALPLHQAGARSFVYIARDSSWSTPSAASIELLVLNACITGGLTRIGPIINVTQEQIDKPELLDSVFAELSSLDADLVVFEFGQDGNPIFIERMRRNNYNPRSYIVWGTGSYPEVRSVLGWQSGFGLISEAYSPYLANADPLWISTSEYDALYRASYNTSSAFADANLAAGISLLNSALLRAANVTPSAIKEALFSLDMDTIVGHISFTNGSVNRPLYCFQNSPDGSRIITVWPSDVPSYELIAYPALVSYPPHYFDQFKKHRNVTLIKVLAGTFGSLALILIMAALLFVFYRYKYHFVLLPKGGRSDDSWA